MTVRLAITLGDPRGIGPEIVAKVLETPPHGAEFLVIGPDELLGDYAKWETLSVGPLGSTHRFGEALPAEVAGQAAGQAIIRATELAMAGDVAGIVTAPVEKLALHRAGFRVPGQTEWLAELAGGVDVAMMLASDVLRVVLITTHLALRDVPDAVTREAITRTARVTITDLQRRFRIPHPRLALCALNPHAGEAGLFGTEDRDVLGPAAQEAGITGPLPADTVFVRSMRGEFDAVLAPYHDVGMTAIKVASFGEAVNITLGLPFVRTSPDHGTAFDIAGTNRADPGSMRHAIAKCIDLLTSH